MELTTPDLERAAVPTGPGGRGPAGRPVPRATAARAYPALKRTLDVGLAVGGLTVSAPVWGWAALRIKRADGGPVLYRGVRVGAHGRPFRILKFRTMVVDAESLGGSNTAADDPRLTGVGRTLRRWKLDELPQLVNVLRGDMSLVGPRPQVPDEADRYTADERRLLDVRPGLTDWSTVLFRNEEELLAGHADVDRAYDELIRPRKLDTSLRYVEQRSLLTDLRILALTGRAILRPAGAAALVGRQLAVADGATPAPIRLPRPRGEDDGARKVSAIMPTYNEAAFIDQAVDSVLDGSVTELLVVDGGSTDGTRDIVARLEARHPAVRLIDNPRRTAASAMNIGLQQAGGDVIVRLDAHSVYPPGYVSRLVTVLDEHGADVTGGACEAVPRRATPFGRAVAASFGNKWVVGNAGYRLGGGDIRRVDTVPFGCWRADTLRRAGGFDEELLRSQDYELSQRLRRMGANILLVPDVVIHYQARSGFWENARHQYANGYWVGYPLAARGTRFRPRHLAPAGACLGAVGLLAASVVQRSWRPLALAAPYGAVLLAAAREAAKEQPPAVVAMVPLVTASAHVGYGLGTIQGLVRGGRVRVRQALGLEKQPNHPTQGVGHA